MYRVSRGLLTCHRRLLDPDHGQALASCPPVIEECCLRPAIRLHGPTGRAGFAPSEPTSPQSSVSSTSDNQLQEDVNTSVSWDLVDTDTDAEVANINTRQNNAVDLNNAINTLYNQDFFVADTTGRRLSQVADKSSYEDGTSLRSLPQPH